MVRQKIVYFMIMMYVQLVKQDILFQTMNVMINVLFIIIIMIINVKNALLNVNIVKIISLVNNAKKILHGTKNLYHAKNSVTKVIFQIKKMNVKNAIYYVKPVLDRLKIAQNVMHYLYYIEIQDNVCLENSVCHNFISLIMSACHVVLHV